MSQDEDFKIQTIDKVNSFINKIIVKLADFSGRLEYMKYETLFGERADDIFISTYMKSGTTWMQMIVYQLTTDGNMDFEHIYEVSPWLRNLCFEKKPVPQNLPSPRIIKSHDPYNWVRKDVMGRFIYVVRNERDVALSLYHHRKNYNNSKLELDDLLKEYFFKDAPDNYFTFNTAWLENKNGLNILYVRYEDLHTNFEGEVTRIARFLNVPVTPALMQRVKERSSFEFMKQHENKFGEQPPAVKQERVYNQFLRTGKVNEGYAVLSEEQKKELSQMFNTHLAKFEIMKPYQLPVTKSD